MSEKGVMLNVKAIDTWLESPIGAAARQMALSGLYLFPCHGITKDLRCTCNNPACANPGKHPFTTHGLTDATDNIINLAELFKFRTDLNLAMATGTKSKLLVIDIDGNKGGFASLEKLEEKYGELPQTPTSITGNGEHRLFNLPEEKIKNRANATGSTYPGIDVRTTGGYVIVPPSTHVSGRQYRWSDDMPEETIDLPGWMIELVKDRPKPIKEIAHDYSNGAASDWSKDEVWRMLDALSPDMSYDDWLHVGMALHEGGFNLSMWDTWSRAGSKYQPGDCEKRWHGFDSNSGITMGTLVDMAMLQGWKPAPPPAVQMDTSSVDDLVERIQSGKIKEMPDFKLNFDPLDLPGLVGDTVRWITKYALRPQPELAMLNVLAFASAIFGRRYKSPINTRTNLYVVGVARTGAGKEFSRQCINELAQASGLLDYLGASYIRSDIGLLSELQKKPSQVMMIDELGMYLEAISNVKAPTHFRNIASVLTKLYSSSGSLYDHGSVADPKMKPLLILAPSLSIYGTTTEKKYVKAFTEGTIESGELNRFIVYKSNRVTTGEEEFPEPLRLDDELIDRWKELAPNSNNLGALLGAANVIPEADMVEWDEECLALVRSYYKEQEIRASQEDGGASLWVRLVENSIKIAMIFAICRNPITPRFSKKDLQTAYHIVETCIHYMVYLASEHMAETPLEGLHKEIVNYIKKHYAKSGVTRSKLTHRFRKISRKSMDEMINALIDQEVLTCQTLKTSTKPLTVYFLA